MPAAVEADSIDRVLHRHRRDATRLVQILREVQDLAGWLSPETLTAIADGLRIPRSRVESTAGFYAFFRTRPAGRYRVLFSDNVTDRMLGSAGLMRALCERLLVEPGRVSEDGLVEVDTASCTGLCDQGPAALVGDRAVSRLTTARIDAMADLIRERVPVDDWPADWFRVDDNLRRTDLLLNAGNAPGEAIGAALDRGAEALLAEIERSGLRGRGGAGYPTARKWRACRDAPGPDRWVVCNADEGEPGTFKDRVLLSARFDQVVDGMCVAAIAIGARRGLLYLRGEYRFLRDRLESRLAARRASGLLGRDILGRGFDFDLEIHLGAGAYVCGEESALIESLEGKPGKPRIRPPFPVTHGYLGQPTAVNNVETLAAAALIAVVGGERFRATGTPQSTGTKLLSVSGDVARPGIYEYPFGVRLAEVLADCGASDPMAVATAGAAGPVLAADEFDRQVAFEDVATGGSIMVFGHGRDPFEIGLNFAGFFAHESCGFCTPCRVGTAVNARLMDKLAAGRGSPCDLDEMDRMHRLMQGASHCGLGNTATLALQDLRVKFPEAFRRRLHSTDYVPGFDLDAALSQARRMTGRDDPGAHLDRDVDSQSGNDSRAARAFAAPAGGGHPANGRHPADGRHPANGGHPASGGHPANGRRA